MFSKLVWFVLLLSAAFIVGAYMPNRYTTIECDRVARICKSYNTNSVLKTKSLVRSVQIRSKNISNEIFVRNRADIQNLQCATRQQTITRRNGDKDVQTTYLLTSVGVSFPDSINSLHEYSSKASCEIDRAVLQAYFSSNSQEPFVYVLSGSWLRYLWYLLSAFFVVLAFLILLKGGRPMAEAEEKQLHNLLSPEEQEQLQAGAKNLLKHISNLDKLGADVVKETEQKLNKYKSDKRW